MPNPVIRLAVLLSVLTAAAALPATRASAQDTLPVPVFGVRPIRPTFAEDAYVLDVGRLHLEGGYSLAFNSDPVPNLHLFDILAAVGVLDMVEARLGWDVVGLTADDAGIGDISVAIKGGFLGGLREETALAGIFRMQLPTGSSLIGLGKGVRFFGGLAATQVFDPVQLDLMLAIDTHLFIEDPTFFVPISLALTWAPLDLMRVYADGVVSLDMTDLSNSQTSIMGGAGYRFIKELEINASARVGLSPELPDVTLQLGVAWMSWPLWE